MVGTLKSKCHISFSQSAVLVYKGKGDMGEKQVHLQHFLAKKFELQIGLILSTQTVRFLDLRNYSEARKASLLWWKLRLYLCAFIRTEFALIMEYCGRRTKR